MTEDIIRLDAVALSGPRSFFTDLDPKDPNYDRKQVELKLKLQFLLKEKVAIAASSLFTDTGYTLLSSEEGLVQSLEEGIIVPAIRNEYVDAKDFFERYKHTQWSPRVKEFFIRHTTHSIPWDLEENSSWFEKTFRDHLMDSKSLLRTKTELTEFMAQDFLHHLDTEKDKLQTEYKYLRREHIYAVASKFGEDICSYITNYADLVYRISGSRVVNCESHFPQSNLTNLRVTEADKLLSEDSIFWDIYVETVMAFLRSAIRLTPERLDSLSFIDVLKIRKRLLDKQFTDKYDSLIEKAKAKVDIHDPDRMILQQQEINAAAHSLRKEFTGRILTEAQLKETNPRENSMWELANVLALISSPKIGLMVGTLSAFKSIPEITSLLSKSLAESIRKRYEWMHSFINHRIGWSKEQKKILLDGYRELIEYGLIK